MNIVIRQMSIQDYNDVLALWRSSKGVVVSDADSRDSIERYLNRNASLSLVAYDGKVLVAAVLCGHDGRRGFIYHLAVRKEYQRRGIGRQLVEQCLKGLSLANIDTCHIFILDDNKEALVFWEKMQWHKLQWMNKSLIIMSSRMPDRLNDK
jgi:putative acetyltransferase